MRSRVTEGTALHEDQAFVVIAPLPVSIWPFVAACAIAGALAVPADAVASSASAVVAGLVGFLGLRQWHSRHAACGAGVAPSRGAAPDVLAGEAVRWPALMHLDSRIIHR